VLVRSINIGGAAMNIHQRGNGIWLVARQPTPGSADFCFRWAGTAEDAEAYLRAKGVEVIEGRHLASPPTAGRECQSISGIPTAI
jgi:hypothetical protein